MSKITKIEYNGFIAELTNGVLVVTKNAESRFYPIPEKNNGIEYKNGEEYFYIRTEGFYYQFKFEVDNGFVGDKFNDKDEFLDTFACHVFGEDSEE